MPYSASRASPSVPRERRSGQPGQPTPAPGPVHRHVLRRRAPPTGGPGRQPQQVTQRQQARPGALEHRHPAHPEAPGGGSVDGAAQVGQHDHRLGRGRRGAQRGTRVAVVPVVLLDQVDGQSHRGHLRILGHGGEAVAEEPLGVRSRPPDVQRVGRLQSRIEQPGQPAPGVVPDGGEGDADRLGHVGHQRPLGSRVVHRGDAGAGTPATRRPPPGGQELEGVTHLVEVAHPDDPMGLEEGLPGPVGAGQRARVGRHHGPPGHRRAHGQGHDGDLLRGGPGQRRLQALGLPEGLEQ